MRGADPTAVHTASSLRQQCAVVSACVGSLSCFAGLGNPFSAQRERTCMPRRSFIILWLPNEP